MRDIVVCVSNDNENINAIETIDAIKEAGFKDVFIQWYNKEWEYSQEDQLRYIKQQDLNIVFAHLGYSDINSIWVVGERGESLVDKYKQDLDAMKKNNIPLVVMHLTAHLEVPKYNELGLTRLRKIVDYAKELGIKVAFENTKASKGYLEYVLENIKNDNVGICYDAGHNHAHLNDTLDLSLFKDRIFAVHLHDNDASSDQHLLPFDGNIDWELNIKKLKENGYDGPITLELIYWNRYVDMKAIGFYKKGYELGEKLRDMFEKENIN